MLFAKVRHERMYDGNIDDRFHAFSEPEWFDDPYVNQIVETIDKNKVLARGIFESPVLGFIGPDRLSGGCKALIMAYKKPDLEQWMGLFGDNCVLPLIEISKTVDVTIVFSYAVLNLPDEFEATFVQTGRATHTKDEFLDEYCVLMHEANVADGLSRGLS